MTLKYSNISKRFGKRTLALNNISLEFSSGVYGLLGANGAGKTTLMQILATLISPSNEGVITYNGEDINKDQQSYRNKLGYWPQECNLPNNFTVKELLLHIAQFKNIEYKEAIICIDKLLTEFNLQKKRDSLIKKLSGGERQRLGISQAFLGAPEIVILDEPTRGLDIDEQNRMYDFLKSHNDKIILISSHIVHDIESTCASVIIINEGEILYSGKINDIIDHFKGEAINPSLENIYLQIFKSKNKITLSK